VRALRTWPYYGVPENPAGWIMQVAKNIALDVVRREKVFRDKQPDIATIQALEGGSRGEKVHENGFADDRLPMLFVCCHPAIPIEAQVALALKTLCGFGVKEISSAFLTNEAVIAKRLTRAKQKLREENIEFEIPPRHELQVRLDAVLHTLYLLFNEGYKASTGDSLVRADLCHEAIRMAQILVKHPCGDQPRVHALIALMLLTAARLPSRTDDSGNMLAMKDQDRTKWDRALIAHGMYHLAMCSTGEELSAYHLQAAIASYHCMAPSFEETDWPRIVQMYDHLHQMDNQPLVGLNRAIAVAQVDGPEAGLREIAKIRDAGRLDSYYLYHAALGELKSQLGNMPEACIHFRMAHKMTEMQSERAFLEGRIRSCEEVLAT